MWYQLTTFLSFQFKSVLSPLKSISKEEKLFFQNLNNSVDATLLNRFNTYRKELLTTTETIKVTDFGAGSRIFKSDVRPVGKIAKVAGISNKKAKRLISLCAAYQPHNILEIGTSLGLGTFALHLGAKNANIISVEGCPNTAEIAKRQLQIHGANNVEILLGNFDSTLPSLLKEKQFDFIYFDGNHSKKATLNYFEWAVKNAQPGSIFIFDDIHWSKEMNNAWKEIRNHVKVKSHFTTYEWGILFF